MFKDLSDIKRLRKQLGLTQHQLAKQSHVSQSLIAKIEAGKIDPTYTNARRIFETLDNLSFEVKLKAKEVMNKKLVLAKPAEKITQVVADMKKHGISQLPVIESHSILGFISESIILTALLDGKKNYVEEIMTDPPPTVAPNTSIDVVSGLLIHFPMVLVTDKGKVKGIITKSDIIGNI